MNTNENEKILKLNDFISYDCKTEKFIVEEHIIKIEKKEFSFNDLKNSDNKFKYKKIMQEIYKNGKSNRFKTTKHHRERSTGNSTGRDYKKSIENFIMRQIGVPKNYDIFGTKDFSLSLKK